MSTVKHTPGPWKLIGGIKNNELNVWVHGKDPTPDTTRELQVIKLQDDHPVKEHLQRRLADFKLIAAAPELLEALTTLIEIGKRDLSNPKYDGYFKSAKAAIAKATT